MSKKADLIGERFGKLVVIEESGRNKHGEKTWLCKCDCGNKKIVPTSYLKRNVTKSCGCSNWAIQIKDITGQKYGRLTVLKFVGTNNKRNSLWECQCECGKKITIKKNNLTTGNTKSCGCLNLDSKTKHGKCAKRLYRVWTGMKQRCLNPNCLEYHNYGGRGIGIFEGWLDFETFYEWAVNNGYIENAPKGKNTIDRIDVNGNYEPGNCRWVDAKVQANNTRSNKLITFNNKTQTVAQWAEELNMRHNTLHSRLFVYHWSVEKALTTPVNVNMRRRVNDGT